MPHDYLVIPHGLIVPDWLGYFIICNYWFWRFLFVYISYKLQKRGIDYNLVNSDFRLNINDYRLYRKIGLSAYWDFRRARAKREEMIAKKRAEKKRKVDFFRFLKSIPKFFKICYYIFLKIQKKIRIFLIIFWIYFKKFCKNFSFICYKIYCYSTVFAFPYIFPKIVAFEICSILTQQYFYVKMYIIKCYLQHFYNKIKNFFLSFKIINFIMHTKVFIYVCNFFKNIYHQILVKLGLRKKTIKIKKWVKKKKNNTV